MDSEPIQKKVVLLGNTSVGKTSIFNRIINDTCIEEGVSTTSSYYRSTTMTVPGFDRKLKMHLWDTAG